MYFQQVKLVLGMQLDKNISAYVDDVVVQSKKGRITFRTSEKLSPTFYVMA